MSTNKKMIRENFRNKVFTRDGYVCVMCGLNAKNNEDLLDAHHIIPREKMKNGGYVKENGISLCKDKCHLKAEDYLNGTYKHEGFSPEDLYLKIKSSYELAQKASERLK